MSERYELSLPFTPLRPPSQAYRDGWDRVFGKKNRDLGQGSATPPPREHPHPPVAVAAPRLPPDPGNLSKADAKDGADVEADPVAPAPPLSGVLQLYRPSPVAPLDLRLAPSAVPTHHPEST